MLRRTGIKHLEDREDTDSYWVERETQLPRGVNPLTTHNFHVHFRLQRLQAGDSYRTLLCLPSSQVI